MRPSRHGFTLVELLVVIFMLGALGAMVLPKMTDIILQSRVQRAAQMLQTDVQQAFAIAGRNRRPIKLTWSSSDMQLQVTDRDGSTIYRRTGLGGGSGFGFQSADVIVSPTTLQIFPNGLAEDTLYIKLAMGGFDREIRVSRAGIVRLQ